VGQSPVRKIAIHPAGGDLDSDLEVSLNRVEMWWCVVAVVHGDDDAEEPADFRHA
jgi:hypothetical protein